MGTSLGEYARERRQSLSIKQQDLADALGYTVQAISKFENGHSELALSSLPSLAKLLSLSLDDLLHEADIPAGPASNGVFSEDNIASNLAYLRGKNGLTIIEAASKVGINRRTLLNYESGQSLPYPSAFVALADLYAVSCDDLLNKKMAPALATPKTKGGKGMKPLLFGGVSALLAASIAIGVTYPLWAKKDNSEGSSLPSVSSSRPGSDNGDSHSPSSNDDPALSGVWIDGFINGVTSATLTPGSYYLGITVSSDWWSVDKYGSIKWEIDSRASTDPNGASFSYDSANCSWSLLVKDTSSDKGIFSFRPYIVSEKGPADDVHSETSVTVTFANPSTDYTPTSDFVADLVSFTANVNGATELYLRPGVYNISCLFNPADWGVKNAGQYHYLYEPTSSSSTLIAFGYNGISVGSDATEADSSTFYVHVENIHKSFDWKRSENTITIHGKKA